MMPRRQLLQVIPALCALLGMTSLVHGAEQQPLPGVPSAEALILQLRDQDEESRTIALQDLYLLSDADLAVIGAWYQEHGFLHGEQEVFDRVRLLHRDPATLAAYAERMLRTYPPCEAITQMSAAELQPLAQCVAQLLQSQAGAEQRAGAWVDLAVITGNRELLRAAVPLMVDHRLPRGDLPAGSVLANLPPQALDDPLQCLALLQALRPGFNVPPPALVTELSRSGTSQIRARIALLLADSTDASVLPLAASMCSDPDQQVRSAAAAAMLTFQPTPPQAAILRLASSAAFDNGIRVQAWDALAGQPEFPVGEARRVLQSPGTDGYLKSAIAGILARHGDSDWLLEQWDRLDRQVQATVATSLGTDFTPQLKTTLDRVLDGAVGPNAGMLLSAVARTGNAQALEWIISRLKDPRSEVSAAAELALEVGTGLRGPDGGAAAPTRSGQEQTQRGGPDHRYQAWSAWWQQYQAPLTGEPLILAQEYRAESDRAQRLSLLLGLPLQLALRLSCEAGQQQPLYWLDQRHDPGLDSTLLGLLDDLQFSRRTAEVAKVIQGRGAHPQLVAAMHQLLGSDAADHEPGARGSAAAIAAGVLIAWRVDAHAAAVSRAIIIDGLEDGTNPGLLAGLDDWYPPATATLIHALLFPTTSLAEPDEQAAQRALQIYQHHAGTADIADLVQLLRASPGAAATAASVLTALALGGNATAQKAFAAALVSPTSGEVAMQALVDALLPEVMRSRSTSPTPALVHPPAGIATMLATLPAARGTPAPPVDTAQALVPEAVLTPLRHILTAHGDAVLASQRPGAIVALSLAGDPLSLQAISRRLTRAENGMVAMIARGIAGGRRLDCLPYAEALVVLPALSDVDAEALLGWLAQVGGASPDAVTALRQLRVQQSGQSAGGDSEDPVLAFAVTWPNTPLVCGQHQPLVLQVRIRNCSPRPVTFAPALTGVDVRFTSNATIGATLALPDEQLEHGEVTIAAGEMTVADLTVTPPNWQDETGVAQLQVRWTPLPGRNAIVFSGPWQPLSIFSAPLAAYDRRSH